ncbi:MAG: nuclear transport factor 2 family protein [Verrucomicrobiaceae bacterium]|nr:MAG: nuclear transport factor 2 family protein [Verrucomicrobiaceae bacterium]
MPLVPSASAEEAKEKPAAASKEGEQEITALSKQKWQWMSEQNVEALSALFHEKAVFVHMGGMMTREQELNVIKGGMIQYKKADIQETTVKLIGGTAILFSKIRLLAVVGGNEVTNPFVVTEVYVKEGEKWKLGSLSFTRTMGQ